MSEWFKEIWILLSIFNTNLLLSEAFSISVFEPEDNEDNEKEYQTLHGEYKNLVSQYIIKTIYLELL